MILSGWLRWYRSILDGGDFRYALFVYYFFLLVSFVRPTAAVPRWERGGAAVKRTKEWLGRKYYWTGRTEKPL